MDCFGTYFTHAQACDNVRVKSATQWTASVHTLRMPKPVITFVFKVLRNGLLRYIYFTHVAICDNVPVGRTFEWFWVAAKICDPAAIRCCFTGLLATQHTYLKKQHMFLFIGTLVCLVFIGFYNRFSHGGQYLGVVTRSRAQFNIWSFFVPKNVPDLFTTFPASSNIPI